MCWGFDHGDGWFNIIDALCSNIQSHIDWQNENRQRIIKRNQIAEAGKSGNVELFADMMAEEYGSKGLNEAFIRQRSEDLIRDPLVEVPREVEQVVVDQVKEKFGTLRFYYHGGDDYIRGLVSMAESMSGVTCEGCGNLGERRRGGWIHTYCESCEEKRETERAKIMKREGYEE
jgi:hypothetical protein